MRWYMMLFKQLKYDSLSSFKTFSRLYKTGGGQFCRTDLSKPSGCPVLNEACAGIRPALRAEILLKCIIIEGHIARQTSAILLHRRKIKPTNRWPTWCPSGFNDQSHDRLFSTKAVNIYSRIGQVRYSDTMRQLCVIPVAYFPLFFSFSFFKI